MTLPISPYLQSLMMIVPFCPRHFIHYTVHSYMQNHLNILNSYFNKWKIKLVSAKTKAVYSVLRGRNNKKYILIIPLSLGIIMSGTAVYIQTLTVHGEYILTIIPTKFYCVYNGMRFLLSNRNLRNYISNHCYYLFYYMPLLFRFLLLKPT